MLFFAKQPHTSAWLYGQYPRDLQWPERYSFPLTGSEPKRLTLCNQNNLPSVVAG